MQFLVMTLSGELLPVARSLRAEGHTVHVYVHRESAIYAGMEPNRIASPKDAWKFVESMPPETMVLVDGPGDCVTERDLAMASAIDKAKQKDGAASVFGPFCEFARKIGHLVYGGLTLADRWRRDPEAFAEMGARIGVRAAPRAVVLGENVATFLKRHRSTRWRLRSASALVFEELKPCDILSRLDTLEIPERCYLQQIVEGNPYDEIVWFDGAGGTMFRYLTGCIPRFRASDGELGPALPAPSAAVFWAKRHPVARWNGINEQLHFDRYFGPLRAQFAITKEGPVLLDLVAAVELDALLAHQALLRAPLAYALQSRNPNIGREDETFAVTTRGWIAPYPYHDASAARGTPVDYQAPTPNVVLIDVEERAAGQLSCAGSSGCIAAAVGTEDRPEEAFQKSLYWLSRVKVEGMTHRTDGAGLGVAQRELPGPCRL